MQQCQPVRLHLEPVCLSSGSSSSSAPHFRTGEAGAAPNGDFGGDAPEHLQEELELFLYCFGGATNSSSVAPAPAPAPRAELFVRSPNKRGLNTSRGWLVGPSSTPRKQEQVQQHTTPARASPATHHASRSKPSSTPTQAEPASERWLFSQPNGALALVCVC